MSFISQDKVFYGVSAFLGVIAIIYFGFEYLVALSPFTISTILFSVFLAFLGLGLEKEGNTAVLSYIFSAGAYIVGLFYTMGRFGFGSDGVMASLIISSGLFAGLGYLVTQRDFELGFKRFKYGLIILGLIVGGLVVYDIGSEDTSYQYFLEEEVTVSDEIDAGHVTVLKESYLPYRSSAASFSGCLYNETGDIQRRAESHYSMDVDTMTFMPLEEQEDIVFEFDTEEFSLEGDLQVEETSERRCPQQTEDAKLLVNAQSSEQITRMEFLD